MKILLSILFGCTLLFIGWPSFVVAFTGQVVAIIDGDTIDVLHNGQAERIRLNGIDCPEKKQPYGQKAKRFTSSLIFGKQVTVEPLKRDRHGRTVADVLLPDRTNVSHELVKAGFAWWYKQYAPRDENAISVGRRSARRETWAMGRFSSNSTLGSAASTGQQAGTSSNTNGSKRASEETSRLDSCSDHRQPENTNLPTARLSELHSDSAKESIDV